jgi:hypothetical protein
MDAHLERPWKDEAALMNTNLTGFEFDVAEAKGEAAETGAIPCYVFLCSASGSGTRPKPSQSGRFSSHHRRYSSIVSNAR